MKTKIILGIDWFYQKFQAWTQLCSFLLGRHGLVGLNVQMQVRPIRHRTLGFVLKYPIFEPFCP